MPHFLTTKLRDDLMTRRKLRCLVTALIGCVCVGIAPISGLDNATAADADATDGILTWGNGDTLPGQLVEVEGNTLSWNAPEIFGQTLKIDLNYLSAVRFDSPQAGELPETDEFRIHTVSNDVLFGRVAGVSENEIEFVSARHGRFALNRDRIISLQRVQNNGMLYIGPRGTDGWQAHGSGNELTDWQEEVDGSLSSVKKETAICRPLVFPSRCRVEVQLQSPDKLDFVLSLGARENENPRIEVWGDELICRCGLDFVELGPIPPDQRQLNLHIFVDFDEHQMAVYTHAGRLLGRTTSKHWEKPTKGLIVETVEGRLAIKELRIGQWDGKLPQNLRVGETRLHRADGEILYGQLAGYNSDTDELLFDAQPDPESAPTQMTVAAQEVTNLVLSTEAQQASHKGKTLVLWRDGGFLSGDMVALKDGRITLQTADSSRPLSGSLSHFRLLRLPNTSQFENDPDRLFFDGGSLHGTLTLEDNDSAPIRWKPVGGLNSSTLVSRGKARFQRGSEPEELLIDTAAFPDVIFMKGGDVFPCKVAQADPQSIHLTSPIVSIAQVPAEEVKAIELGSIVRKRQSGFADRGWKTMAGAVRATDQEIVFNSTAVRGHPNFMTGNLLSFRVRWSQQTYGNLAIKLFADDIFRHEDASLISLQLAPTSLRVTDDEPMQQRHMVFGGAPNADQQSGLVKVPDRDAHVSLLIRDGQVAVSINGKHAGSFELRTDGTTGRGLCFAANLTRVHVRRVLNNADANNNNVPLSISELKMENVAGTSVAQFIAEETRERMLTIPRFQRDDPPTHVLLAPNGDLLRGRLLEVTQTHVVFESRLETFRFPRERIAGIISLQNPGESEDTQQERRESDLQARLDNGYTLTITPEKMRDGQLIGSSAILSDCSIPAQSIRDLFLGAPEGRAEILSYVHWIPTHAPEPKWDLPESGDSNTDSELIGTVAEDFELRTLDGDLFRLSDHADKVVVLDFWASWCGPCVGALPKYIEATAEFDASDVIFVAVNLEESEERIQQFLTQQNLSPTVALDRGSLIAKRFGVTGIPHSVVLGKGSVIKYVTVGLQDKLKEKTVDRINTLLEDAAGQ